MRHLPYSIHIHICTENAYYIIQIYFCIHARAAKRHMTKRTLSCRIHINIYSKTMRALCCEHYTIYIWKKFIKKRRVIIPFVYACWKERTERKPGKLGVKKSRIKVREKSYIVQSSTRSAVIYWIVHAATKKMKEKL